jgi:hypothetical protein
MDLHAPTSHKVHTQQINGGAQHRSPANGEKPNMPEIIDLSSRVGRLCRLLAPRERIRLQMVLGDGELPVAGDELSIATLFFTLAEYACSLAPNGRVTVVTCFLPATTCATRQPLPPGCALLSVSVTNTHTAIMSLDEPTRPHILADLRDCVRKLGGCFRVALNRSEARFSVYLPVATGRESVYRNEPARPVGPVARTSSAKYE